MRIAMKNVLFLIVCAGLTFGASGQQDLITSRRSASSASDAGSALETVLARRKGWIAKSEAAKPKLFRREVIPTNVVRLVQDAAAFQGCRMESAGPLTKVLGKPTKPGDSFILDFGEHLVGRFSFRLGEGELVMDAPCRLKFTFAETPGELLGFEEKNWVGLSRSWYPDDTITCDFAPMDYTLPRRYAFRYVKVETVFCPPGKPIFESFSATAETSADEANLVQWTAPNEMAGRIDRVARNTLRDCMQTMFEDGPKRDRRLWLGDLRLEALADYVTYRNFDVVKRSLYLLAGTAKDNGLVGTDAYEQPFPKPGNCRILDYTALFPTVVLEYLETSGDRETAEDLWPLCVRQMELVLDSVGEDGVVRMDKGWWYFIDHASLDRQVAEQGAVVYGLKGMMRLAKALGREGEVAFIPPAIGKMSAAARTRFWKPDRGVFAGGQSEKAAWLGQAWAVLSGIATGAEAKRCLEAVLADSKADRPRTPYGYHYFVEALYEAGLRKTADELLLSYWGGMVEKGADTFWEAFVPGDDFASPYGNHFLTSCCHAWSCGPTYLLRSPRFRALSVLDGTNRVSVSESRER